MSGILSSVTTVYSTLVLLIGREVKNFFSGSSQRIWLTDSPAAHSIIRICEGITAARIDGRLIKEERLYWELIDIMRSPEMVKLITDSYLEHKLEIEKKRIEEESRDA